LYKDTRVQSVIEVTLKPETTLSRLWGDLWIWYLCWCLILGSEVAAMTSAGKNHALVFGASGITGWAIVNEILNGYPDPSTFSKVTALTNRPFTQEVSQWPSDERLNIVSGLDLLKGSQQELEESLKARVNGVDTVTHVYVSHSGKAKSCPDSIMFRVPLKAYVLSQQTRSRCSSVPGMTKHHFA
jgi:hypothetical protein